MLTCGSRVKARYLASSGGPVGTKWFPAIITKCNRDGTFDLTYDDGDKEQCVSPKFIKNLETPSSAAPPAAAPPQTSSELSAYELERDANIRENKAALSRLGLEEAAAACTTKKEAKPRGKKRAAPEARGPVRTSRRLSGEVPEEVFVADEEGRRVELGGDEELIASMQAAQQEATREKREEAWEAAREAARRRAEAEPGAVEKGAEEPSADEWNSLDTPLFHMNTFMEAKAGVNRAFGLFLHGGVATPGFRPLDDETARQVQEAWPLNADFKEPLREKMIEQHGRNYESGARQRAIWLTACRPGAYILCRHNSKGCPHTPAALKDASGRYLGGVYALGRVEHFPAPQSEADRQLTDFASDERLEGLGMSRYYLHAVAKVKFFALGYLDDLKPETAGYINKVCQPTLNQVLEGKQKPGKPPEAEKHRRCREDLWRTAKWPIEPELFAEGAAAPPSLVD